MLLPLSAVTRDWHETSPNDREPTHEELAKAAI